MEDAQIIALYIQRDEAAIAETQRKYGAFCSRIATNILSAEDAEECVNDAYHQVWLAIPPQRPISPLGWGGSSATTPSISGTRTTGKNATTA